MISVVLCTHNGAEYVGQQVLSILAQQPEPGELVLGDDASTDGTVAIVEGLVDQHRASGGQVELVVFRHDPPLGVVANFADALEHARGDLIALSDQDDAWHPGKLAAATAAFDADPSLLLLHTDARLVDAAGAPLGMTLLEALEATAGERAGLEHGDAFATLLRRNLVTGATAVLRRELLTLAAPFPAGWVHDEWLAAIASAAGTLRLLPESLIDYRQHDSNQIGARRPGMRDRWAKLREPREPRASRLVARSTALVDALDRLGSAVPPEHLDSARAALEHDRQRQTLPRLRLARLPRVIAAAARGDYSRYSRGGIDVLRDLVQPATQRAAATLDR
ncbi:MAG: glycosyltransferase family 2 protein [Pseudolysinimonas sp.]